MRSQAAAGRVIVGRYELVEPLGEGPLGPLWRARDRDEDREVAVREIELSDLLDEAEQAALAEKVLREAQGAARLTHPGVVPILDVVAEHGHPFVVTELVEGPTLADVVARDGPLSPPRAAAIGLDVLDALGAAHDRGLVHRDVQPSNVLLRDGRGARLTDFGVASLVDDPRMPSSGTTAPYYLAPEQTESAGASPSSDLWSLAATLYYAVEGSPPFDEAAPAATLDAIRGRAVPPSPRAGRLRPLFDVLLVKDPTMRAGRDRARALLAWAAEAPLAPSRPGLPVEPREPEADRGPQARTVPQPAPSRERQDADEWAELEAEAAGAAQAAAPAPPPPPLPPSFPPPPPPPPPVEAGGPAPARAPDEEAAGEAAADGAGEPTVVDGERASPPAGDWREPWFFGLPAETVPPPPHPEPEPAAPVSGDEGRRRRIFSRGVWIGALAVVTAIVMVGLITTGGRQLNPERPSVDVRPDSPPPAEEWTPYTDDAIGFTIRHPPGWTVRRTGNRTYFVHPENIAYLEVDHQQPPADDPLRAWEDLERNFAASHPSYAKVRIEATTFQEFRGAIWEFTHTDNGVDLHTVDLGFVTPEYGFALLFQTRADDWDHLQDVFDSFKAAFRVPA